MKIKRVKKLETKEFHNITKTEPEEVSASIEHIFW